jgi:hypothetical protein
MPYSNPVVLNNMFRATENRINPMETARGKQRLRLMDQFNQRKMQMQEQLDQRKMQMQEQDSRTAMQEGLRKLAKSIQEMDKDKREEARKKIAERVKGDLYAKEEGPEAWARRMKDTKRDIPFEEADRAIAPGVGVGKVFDAYNAVEDRKAEERKNKRTNSYKPTALQSNVPFLAKKMGITEKRAAEILTMSEAMPPEQVAQRLMIDLAKSDEGKGMSKPELEERVMEQMDAIKSVKQRLENPQDPLGLMK